jgi:hypothetical protein
MRGSLLTAVLVCGCTAQPHGDTLDARSGEGGDSDSATPVDSDGWSPSTWQPAGKGLWIWYFAYTGQTAAQAAERAQADHVAYVLIKSGQDASFWTSRYSEANLREFTSRGIHVFAWPYVTPANIPGSIAAIKQAAQVPGTDGLVLDVEIEWEGNYAAQAEQLCQGIRAAVPGVWLGYTSFGWVGYHGALPFSTFDHDCGDAFFPQVYWSDRGVSWQSGLSQAIAMIQQAGLKAPVWVIQSNDNTPSGGAPATTDLNAFFTKAGMYSSLWELPSATTPNKLAQLDSLDFQN